VIGYGPVGRTLTRLLRESDIEPVVIELNLDTFRELRLKMSTLCTAMLLNWTRCRMQACSRRPVSSQYCRHAGQPEMNRLAKEFNPGHRVFARSVHLRKPPR
jgi:CPA2 family monovalent cation:H+ antiporter-2